MILSAACPKGARLEYLAHIDIFVLPPNMDGGRRRRRRECDQALVSRFIPSVRSLLRRDWSRDLLVRPVCGGDPLARPGAVLDPQVVL